MIEKKFYDLDDKLYYKKLDNGLSVYIIPNKNVSEFYLSLFTKYGSNDLKFKKDSEKEYHSVHPGTAHFLEHLMFNKKNGIKILDKFEKLQVSSNAFTDNEVTCFVACGSSNYARCLKLLINYVYHPYFSEENIQRERGIILSEAKRYLDSPNRNLCYEINNSIYNKLHSNIKVEGSLDDINNINIDDINNAYNTFYHPSNMALLITGNVDVNKTMNIINNEFSKLTFSKPYKIDREIINEDENVKRKKYSFNGLVSSPEVNFIVKNKLDRFNKLGLTKEELRYYFKIITICNFGRVSEFKYKLDNDYKISIEHGAYIDYIDDVMNIIIYGKINDNSQEKVDEFIKICNKYINNLKIDKEDFIRKKKNLITFFITSFDDIESLNEAVMNNIISYGDMNTDVIKLINSLDYDKCLEVIKLINIDNTSVVTMFPNDKKDKS